jgi:phosphoglycerate dehydrogenase-like enzyme
LDNIHFIHALTRSLDLTTRASYLATLFWLPKDGKALPNAELIQFFSAGTNHVAQHPIYTDSKIPLCSANGVHGPQIAEWVVMMDLVHSHRFPRLYDLQKEKTWSQKEGMNVSDRVGKRVGVLGYGSIGRQGKSDLNSNFSDVVGGSLWLPTPIVPSLR